MQKIYCTFDDYDKFTDVFEHMYFHANAYVPSKQEMQNIIMKHLDEYIVFLLWILETGVEVTDEEGNSNREERKMIRDIVQSSLILVDTIPEEGGRS